MLRGQWRHAVAPLAALAFVRCASFGTSGDAAPGTDAGAGDAAATDAPSIPDGSDDAPVVANDPHCPANGGPPQVVVQGVCIDAWEVTVGDYKAVAGKVVTNLPNGCADVTFGDPAAACNGGGGGLDDVPVSCVSWCEAYAYCKQVGRRLCGARGGGPVSPSDVYDAGAGEWELVCTNGASRPYATGGALPTQGGCNISALDSAMTKLSATRPKPCRSGEGVYDLPGNLQEWLDSCAGSSCSVGGDSFSFVGASPGACNETDSDPFDTAVGDKGIRCCATPSP